MFEAAELGRRLSKAEFKAREPELHTRLLAAQRGLRGADFPVVVIISGVEGAGQGEVVNRLNTWLDSRGIQTRAFWDETDEERGRPRFWRTLPARGSIAIRMTDTGHCPWHIVDAENRRHRDAAAGEILLDALERRLAERPARAEIAGAPEIVTTRGRHAGIALLDAMPMDAALDGEAYRRRLERHQRELNALAWPAHARGRNTVAVFEGCDASGKGGAMRRVTAAVDARLYRVISVAAPTDEERAEGSARRSPIEAAAGIAAPGARSPGGRGARSGPQLGVGEACAAAGQSARSLLYITRSHSPSWPWRRISSVSSTPRTLK